MNEPLNKYVLIYQESTIVLTFMEDENHPWPVAIFPKEEEKTAEYLLKYLNETKPLIIRNYPRPWNS